MKRIDISGNVYGRLTVLGYDKTFKSASFWRCLCECGKIVSVASASLRYGLSKSCGCLSVEIAKGRATHGEARRTKEYKAWASLKSRCYTKSDQRYYCYGAIGIKVCDRWKNSYENFLLDMGRAPSKDHSIDRIINEGDYEPGNCRWATDIEQANNRKRTFWIEFNGRKMSLANWCRFLNVNYKYMHKQMKTNGLTFEQAIRKTKTVEKLKPI